jgi:tRNA-intron endonuclease
VKAIFDGTSVVLAKEGLALYEQGGYGRREESGLRLAPVEALYLIHRGKIAIPGHDFDSFLAALAARPEFLRSYLVYRDIRERGYVIQPGPHDFRVFQRGHKPGKGRSQYTIRVISERELIDFARQVAEIETAAHMRKTYILAVVDDEDELTYYAVKQQEPAPVSEPVAFPPVRGMLLGTSVIAPVPAGTEIEGAWFGTRLDPGRLMLAPIETVYLLGRGLLGVGNDGPGAGAFLDLAAAADLEMREKAAVYRHLRDRGYVPRTGYKFGHHFRVYSGQKKHSEMLVHALPEGATMQMSVISRSVRLAHSVRKKMLFAIAGTTTIQYIEFSRIKL